ncbi:MAG TPA: mucoidy inhibitor MuiA family protein [Ktedonobacteraceae bacterium]|nr:mucoidy inhibitor MuiA family protein [Ktedonobacteraceae bacterium]
MIDLEAPIKEVTVYSDRALVTRRGGIQLEAGEHELRVNNLPQFLRDSLRAAGRGTKGIRILNVDVSTAFLSRPPEAELVSLQDELERLVQKQQLLEARRNALNDRRQWLRALGEQSRDFARGLAQGQMKPQDCADFFSFAANQALQDAEAAQGLELEMKQVQQEIAAKKRELAQKQGDTLADRLAAVVTVALADAGEFELELSYLVLGAAWHPQYDVRVQMSGEQSEGDVELTYVGVVQQSTGERWENVGLSLSTARPSLAAVLPELDPLYLNVYTPPIPRPMNVPAVPMRAARARIASTAAGNQQPMAMADMLASGEAAFEEEQEEQLAFMPADVATAAVEQTGTALIFRVGRSVDIPSDGSPHKTTIARDNLPCTFDYVSAPLIDEQVHLRGAITNTSERVLLNGEANIFLSGEYVGATKVKTTAPAEKFKIFLGIDDSIKVKRELIERSVEKGNALQANMRRITYGYRITVHNYAAATRQVVIRDRLPVSQHERVKVKVQSIQPAPTERTKLELVTWKFPLAAGAEQKIEYRFVVEYPQDLRVIGLP